MSNLQDSVQVLTTKFAREFVLLLKEASLGEITTFFSDDSHGTHGPHGSEGSRGSNGSHGLEGSRGSDGSDIIGSVIGWWSPPDTRGAHILKGILVNFIDNDRIGKLQRNYLVFELLEACEFVRNQNGDLIQAPRGAIIGVPVWKNLEGMWPDKAGHKVYITHLGLDYIGKGRSMRSLEIQVSKVPVRHVEVREDAQRDAQQEAHEDVMQERFERELQPRPITTKSLVKASSRSRSHLRSRSPKPRLRSRSSKSHSDRLHRRSDGELAKMVSKIVEIVKKSPKGINAESLREKLKVSRRELPMPIKLALKGGKIRKRGHKRATLYLVA